MDHSRLSTAPALPSATRPGLSLDIAVNLVSLLFMAAAGLLLNAAVGRIYGASILGIFNIVFAIYIFLSQFGSFGIQYSTLHFIALASDRDAVANAARTGLKVTLIASSLVTLMAWHALPVVCALYAFDGIETAFLLSLPGLWCFCQNKVLLGILNGMSHMKAFALFQSARYLFILVTLAILVWSGQDGRYITLILTVAEGLLLPGLILYVRFVVGPFRPSGHSGGMARHVSFGMRAMPSGIMGELNTRVDVLLLGFMLGSVQTGVYSIAILLAEGIGQIVTIIRNIISPRLAALVLQRDQPALRHLFRTLGLGTAAFMGLAGAVLCLIFPTIDHYLLFDQFSEALGPLVILIAGLVLSAPVMIFASILSQGGRPGMFSLFMCAGLAANILFNIIGINLGGMAGAAIGTSLAFLCAAGLLVLMTRQLFGLRLL